MLVLANILQKSIDGSGLFKSMNKGNSWTQIASPDLYNDFKNVSRIIVNPEDENEIIVTTSNSVWEENSEGAIYKSIDGGESWNRKRSSSEELYDDIDYDPSNFNTIYVAINNLGVIKSIDGGETWTYKNKGMNPEGRVEIAVSHLNTDRIWASVEGSRSGVFSDLYVSNDGGENWSLLINLNNQNEDFLGGQGWYNNIITPHPFNEDIVYVGGVNTWKFQYLKNEGGSSEISLDIIENGISEFMSLVDFDGNYYDGKIDGLNSEEDLIPIEIRFGSGSQKAHRFTVNGRASGVPDSDYKYENYVDVPFQVWNTQTNTQLMVAFRDQGEDGNFNLIELETSDNVNPLNHSREYIYIYDVPYSIDPNIEIAQDGGIDKNRIYFLWPLLVEGSNYDESNFPKSNLSINIVSYDIAYRKTEILSDAYEEYENPINSYLDQDTRTTGFHPDQHNILIGDIDESNQSFRLYITNDGGVYQSVKNADPGINDGDFEYVSFGYNTTQFYSADKAPGQYRFIGGMQDNGTWYHDINTEGAAKR